MNCISVHYPCLTHAFLSRSIALSPTLSLRSLVRVSLICVTSEFHGVLCHRLPVPPSCAPACIRYAFPLRASVAFPMRVLASAFNRVLLHVFSSSFLLALSMNSACVSVHYVSCPSAFPYPFSVCSILHCLCVFSSFPQAVSGALRSALHSAFPVRFSILFVIPHAVTVIKKTCAFFSSFVELLIILKSRSKRSILLVVLYPIFSKKQGSHLFRFSSNIAPYMSQSSISKNL